MDSLKIGKLIYSLRKDKGLTQRELADKLHLSDRTISKWERGIGIPDISLLKDISKIFNIDIENILNGEKEENNKGGNMRKISFYVCPTCGNILVSLNENSKVSCCGNILDKLSLKDNTNNHMISVEEIENDYYITLDHEMNKDHYINFVAYVSFDSVNLIPMFPEQSSSLRIPKHHKGKIYYSCNKDGLFVYNLK